MNKLTRRGFVAALLASPAAAALPWAHKLVPMPDDEDPFPIVMTTTEGDGPVVKVYWEGRMLVSTTNIDGLVVHAGS